MCSQWSSTFIARVAARTFSFLASEPRVAGLSTPDVDVDTGEQRLYAGSVHGFVSR